MGEKTARKLLEKYGTLENVLAHAGEEKGALQKKLLDGAESARMSYRVGVMIRMRRCSLALKNVRLKPRAWRGRAR